jgi:hypothetical protein
MNLLSLILLVAQAGSVTKEPMRDLTVAVGPKLPSYRFHFIWDEDPKYKVVNAIQVFKGNSKEPVQVLDDCEMTNPPDDAAAINSWLKTEDFNFDGYLDLALVNWMGGTGNVGYCIWLFDPKTEKYTLNAQFSELIGNHKLDPSAKTITTSSNGSADTGSLQIYAVRENKLVLILEEVQEGAKGKCPIHWLRREQRDGKLVVTAEKWFKPSDNGEQPCTP